MATVRPSSGGGTATLYTSNALTTVLRVGNTVQTLNSGSSIKIIETGSKAYKISYPANTEESATYATVNSSGLRLRSGPSTSSQILRSMNSGTRLALLDGGKKQSDENGDPWYHVRFETTDSGVGTVGYVMSYYVTPVNGTAGYAWISKSDVSNVESSSSSSSKSTSTETYAGTVNDERVAADIEEFTNWQEELANEIKFSQQYSEWGNYVYDANEGLNHKYFMDRIKDLNYAFGAPPKYNMDIDVQYDGTTVNGVGRVLGSTFYSNPTILSICPGKVKLFPNMFGVKKDSMMDALISAAGGDSTLLAQKLQKDENAKFTGKMYTFAQDTVGFSKRLNALCRGAAILLGIGDKFMPYTSTKLKDFDYSYWSIRHSYTPNEGASFKNYGIFGSYFSAVEDSLDSAVMDSNYIHFICSNSATQVSESMTNDTGPNAIMQQLQSTVNSATATLSYFLGTGFNDTQDFSEAISSGLESALGVNGWTKLADNLMNGGQMVFPDQITGVNYSQAVSCSLNFVSPYGDPLSVFLWCIVPTLNILALALPKQVADNMYTFPHICRVCQKGWFNSNLCVLSDVNITRGGSDDTSWTLEGLATDWVVSFSIVPLITNLMVTSTDNPFMFMKNDGMIDYLGNLCAFDLRANNAHEKVELFKTLIGNYPRDFFSPNRLGNHISDTLNNTIRRAFALGVS